MRHFHHLSFLWVSVIGFGIFSQGNCISPPRSGDLPWMTGPIFTPSARVVPVGHVNLEPYLIWRQVNGKYDRNGNASSIPTRNHFMCQLPIKVGILKDVDLTGLIQSDYNWSKRASSAGFGDLIFGAEYQLISDKNNRPPVKIYFQEIFPTGKYQKLNPSKLGNDSHGLGSYISVIGFTIAKLLHFRGENYLNMRLNISSLFPTSVRVKGISTYGGDSSSKGKVFPGKSINVLSSAEYSLTRNWVLACDLTASFASKTRFKGHTLVPLNHPSTALFTLAPAIEYNFTKEIGIIAGTWFTFAGRNAERFTGLVVALNWYF